MHVYVRDEMREFCYCTHTHSLTWCIAIHSPEIARECDRDRKRIHRIKWVNSTQRNKEKNEATIIMERKKAPDTGEKSEGVK